MKKIYLLGITLTILVFTSCQKKPDVGGTATEKMANEWWVQLYEPDGSLSYPPDYYGKIATYNTAANTGNELWLDDLGGNIWDFKVKVNADQNNLTFSADQAESVVDQYNIKITVTDGKIIPNGGHSKTGVITDSIYMNIEFEDDPGKLYSIRGHARTRFAEDDY
jgi:hypothetical protein